MNDDIERALDMYELLAAGGDQEELLVTIIDGPPPSKARARVGRGGRVYSSQEQRAAEEGTAWRLRRLMGGRPPWTGNVALGCVFFRPNSQRIDTDNMLKHVCDAANGILWLDDSQVTAVMGTAELDAERPRTILVVGRHASSLKRGTDAAYPCAVCEKPMMSAESAGKKRVTCSPACANVHRGYRSLAEHVPCAQCGQPFRRRTSAQKLCGQACQTAHVTGRNKERARPKSRCLDCNAQLDHHRGGRCRACWRASIKARINSEKES